MAKARGFSRCGVDPKLVRVDQLGENKKPSEQNGVRGDPRAATKELGGIGIKRIVEASVQAIRKLPPLNSNPSRNPGSSKRDLDPSTQSPMLTGLIP